MRSARALAFCCFFLSGASALVYQVVWTRQLVLTVGATTAAVSMVLAAFMGGLAAGSAVFGRAADRSREPLKLYAYLEAGIGLYALALPALMSAWAPLYLALARSAEGSPVLLMLLRLAFGFALLAPPTVLMGGTLPALVRFVARSSSGLRQDLSALYGLNLAGAVAGSVATGFLLIRVFGIRGATMVAVLVNLAVAAAALVWSGAPRRAPGVAPPAVAKDDRLAEPGAALPAGVRPIIWAVVFLSGLVTMGYEVLWTRILIFSFQSTVHTFSIILATFLAGLALGSFLLTTFDNHGHSLRVLAGAEILSGLTALALAPLSARIPDVVGALSGRLGYTGTAQIVATFVGSALVLLVPTTLAGIVFPLSMRLLVDDLRYAGRGVGAAYAANTVGAVAGSLATGFLVIPLLSLKGGLMLLSALPVAAGWLLLPWCGGPAERRRWLGAASALLLAAGFAGVAVRLRGPNPFDRIGHAPVEAIEAHHDGVAASVSVVRFRDGRRALRIDGFEASTDGAAAGYMSLMTHIPLLLHPDPHRILVICFGTGTTAGAGLLYPGLAIDAVDIDRTVFDFARHFVGTNRGIALNARARRVVDDGRNYLLTTRERYDVITSEPMPPTFAGVVNLYSQEYYRLARQRLSPGGLLVQWLPFHLLRVGESMAILRAVQEVFPETSLWIHRGTGIIVARSGAPVEIDLDRVRRRLGSEALRQDLARVGVAGPEGLAGLYMLRAETVRRWTGHAAPITDDRPTLEFHPPRHMNPGLFRPDYARSLEIVFRLRERDGLPLRNASSEEAAILAEHREVATHRLLGDLYLTIGLGEPARTEFEAALTRARARETRARVLLDLARLALSRGSIDDARRRLEQSLALIPDDEEGRRLRSALEGG